MSKFEPGHKKVGGTGNGRNKTAAELRDKLRTYLVANFERFAEEHQKQHGASYTKTYIDAAKFVLPTISSVQFADEQTESSMRDLIRKVSEYQTDK